ncbi:FGGY-family carbohydrate kinase (plasmid) [Erwinia sp. INIA-01]|uniref:FGGY family carbohydrate kinase n=1 Tax=Erwinia sp. INIA01 TaxID=2991500 RepID=UPI0022253A98|nr:FGGY-family carbohydrate kinase [Erwinia sp. INIA01]MCW1873093.1 FGGY-family carbohydrate kinase [Erwinia sp. INIA01]
MTSPVILAIDEGTTNAKVLAVNGEGEVVARSSRPLSLSHPQPGWSEQDPWQIWRAVKDAIEECIRLSGAPVAGIAISNQRESVLIWDRKTGEPVTPLISWQDRRSEAFCQQLQESGQNARITALTGLAVDPMFPAAKLTGMLQSIADGYRRAQNGELCIGTVDSWLSWRLSGGAVFVTDHANAARTQLYSLEKKDWDDELLELFHIPRAALPETVASAQSCGETVADAAAGVPAGVPLLSRVGDSHAALYARARPGADTIKATYGTGSSLMMSTERPVQNEFGLSTTVAWHDGTLRYALEGNITHTGSGAAWVSKMLGIDSPTRLTEMAKTAGSNQGIYFVPALSGLGAPWWDLKARGLICGLTDAATPETLARVALESIVFQIADVFFAMEQACGHTLPELYVDGSATANRWLMQLQADVLQRPLRCAPTPEVSALGAAVMAGKVLGWWQHGRDLAALQGGAVIVPRPEQAEAMVQSYAGWRDAIARCRFQPG